MQTVILYLIITGSVVDIHYVDSVFESIVINTPGYTSGTGAVSFEVIIIQIPVVDYEEQVGLMQIVKLKY